MKTEKELVGWFQVCRNITHTILFVHWPRLRIHSRPLLNVVSCDKRSNFRTSFDETTLIILRLFSSNEYISTNSVTDKGLTSSRISLLALLMGFQYLCLVLTLVSSKGNSICPIHSCRETSYNKSSIVSPGMLSGSTLKINSSSKVGSVVFRLIMLYKWVCVSGCSLTLQ